MKRFDVGTDLASARVEFAPDDLVHFCADSTATVFDHYNAGEKRSCDHCGALVLGATNGAGRFNEVLK